MNVDSEQRMTPGRRAVARSAVAAGLVVLAGLSGCYQKVTRAEGFGADRISTESPNRQQGPIDQLIFGKDEKTVRRGPSGSIPK